MSKTTTLYLIASQDISNDSDLFRLVDDFSMLSERVQDFIIWNYVNSPNKYKFI